MYDVANLLYRVAAVQKHTNPYAREVKPEDLVGLCMHISLQSIYKWYIKYKPDFVVFAFEGGDIWRKEYTTKKIVKDAYKGNREYDPTMKHFYELIDSFRRVVQAHTSICCLHIPTMEGDDVIAGYCQLYAAPEHEIIIISADKDFTQLLKLPGVKLVEPDKGKQRNLPGDKEYQEDIDYWLFLKCIRGDGGDNVMSAYPKVRETKIKQAYADPYYRLNFMNEVWLDENQQPHRVGDHYEKNIVLLDLYQQPPEERELLLEGIKFQVGDTRNYSHFQFLKFLGEYKLEKVAERAQEFVNLFANNQRWLKGEKKSIAVEKPTDAKLSDSIEQLSETRLLQF